MAHFIVIRDGAGGVESPSEGPLGEVTGRTVASFTIAATGATKRAVVRHDVVWPRKRILVVNVESYVVANLDREWGRIETNICAGTVVADPHRVVSPEDNGSRQQQQRHQPQSPSHGRLLCLRRPCC